MLLEINACEIFNSFLLFLCSAVEDDSASLMQQKLEKQDLNA